MGVLKRGIKNAFRNGIRSIAVIFILATSISMALVMLIALKTVQLKIDNIKSSIGNYLTISPAGIRGFEGGGELISNDDINEIEQITEVKKAYAVLSDRLNFDTDTNLESAVEAGSFGQRQGQKDQQMFNPPAEMPDSSSSNSTSSSTQKSFTPPISITGTSSMEITQSLGLTEFNLVEGQEFDPASSYLVAMIGTTLAQKNSLSVGSTFTAYDQTIEVVGIFDSGNTFSNAIILMPIKTLQEISDQQDQISQIIVESTSIDTVSTVQTAIQERLGDDVDITTQESNAENSITPLENIKTISLYSLIGSLIAGSVIILLTMIMIVRERRREIGILKAIGASNLVVSMQFLVESTVLTLLSSTLGIIFGFILSNPVLKVLVNNSSETTATTPEGPGGTMGRGMARVSGAIMEQANSVRNITAEVGLDIILYGLLAAIVIAIIGSLIPSFFIAKISPASVMRAE